jgi:hypothetical protein
MTIRITPRVVSKPADTQQPTPTPTAGAAPTPTTTASTPVTVKPGDPGFVGPVAPAKTTPPAADTTHYGPTAAELRAARGMSNFIGDSTAYGTPGYRYCLGGPEDMYTHSQHLHDYEKSIFYRADTARDMYNQVLKHGNINMGAPGVGDLAFFEGHAALGVGGGYVISNDILDKNGKPTYQKILYTDLEKQWGKEGKYNGYTVPTGLYGGKETDPAEALKKELGAAYKLPGTSVGSSGTTGSTDTKPGTGDAVKPAVVATSPTTTSQSTTSSSDRGMFGSLFGSIFGSMSQPSSTVAQSPTASSSTPGVSAQFESHIPTMSDLGSSTSSSAGSASSLDSTGGTENVTVEPVGG